jgi:NAD(P)-dependent dehydrogenase (short-subunit alcohol dehydrogenase family)
MNPQARVVVVTGGAQGIGRHTAELFAERGWRVAILDLREPVETLSAIQANGGEAFSYQGSISDEAIVDLFAAEVFQRYERVDALVNNAGISLIVPAEQTTVSDYRRVLEVNLVAPFLLSKVFGEKMLAARSGSSTSPPLPDLPALATGLPTMRRSMV